MQPTYTPAIVSARSAIPRVVGILAIIFSVLGFGASILFTWGPLHDLRRWGADRDMPSVIDWLYTWAAISAGLFVLHLVGGVLACRYRKLGLRLLTGYAVGALVLIVVDLVLLSATVPHHVTGSFFGRGEILVPRVVFATLAAPWPIIVVALVNLRRARRACGAA